MEDPREFIEGIARSKGSFTESFRQQADEEASKGRRGMLQAIQGTEEIREDLSKALSIISSDLYTSRARFLMEVIQNADDNQYLESSTPTLCINVTPQLVKIECNETGFTEANVKALCRTGRSSKAPGQGYTGEKGIGFKSVFKIAKRAHVRSPPYYFQLDKTRMLGMITPQWDQEYFAAHSEDYQTTIILDRICDDSMDFGDALRLEINAIHPMVILFLRRIERLQMTLRVRNQNIVSRRFRRYTNDALFPRITTLENEDTGIKEHFYKVQYTSNFNGTEERRPNLSQTDIVLAFPVELVSNTWTPRPEQLLTYAYLPLGEFGFQFIIQADFVTTSNRQSVDEDSPWNTNIAKAIPQAFVDAITTFNRVFPDSAQSAQSAQLSKTWPLFLGDISAAPSGYWQNIHQDIVNCLKTRDVIQTRSGSYACPPSLIFLSWAKDRDGEPIFGSNNGYVSSAYPASVKRVLGTLGVGTPDSEWISRELQSLQRSGSLHDKTRSSSWYSDLAKVILTPGKSARHPKYTSELRNIPLIPLAGGSWSVAPTMSTPIYFPQSLGERIPSGLPLLLVDEEACKCEYRTKLFELLGVKSCDASNIVKEIVIYHTTVKRANRSDIVGHAKYLYHAKDQLTGNDLKKIWFLATGELSEIFSGYGDALFLHPDYFQDLNADEKSRFIDWLKSEADIATVPRLTKSDKLHDDFRWILENKSDRVLDIIRRNWDVYGPKVTGQIQRQFAQRTFLCQTGNLVPLRQSFIPLPELVQKSHELCGSDSCSFLVLSGCPLEDWGFLSRFDVGTEDNLDFYLWILEQPGFKVNPSVERAKKLYSEIQSRAGSLAEDERVRNAFCKNVIAFPGSTFVSAENCVYYAPRGFRAKPSLFATYGNDLSGLFQNILRIKFASHTEALDHLYQIRSNELTTMQDVSSVYEYLQDYCPSITVDPMRPTIAIPSETGLLQWKLPSECVWDDSEFSQNELQLRSKFSMQHIIKQHAPAATSFFTSIIKLPNAGIDELLSDLKLLQQEGSDDSATIFRLYERIEVYRRSSAEKIKDAFRTQPLVFLQGNNGNRGRWLKLEDCVWSRTILRTKYALTSTVKQYRSLFQDTLDVPNVTLKMLVQGFMITSERPLEHDIRYSKDLLLDISRKPEENDELRVLKGVKCWPCRLPNMEPVFCAIGDFYVNDRQNLFDIFKDSQTFLDLNFDESRKVIDLLHQMGCVSFLSKQVKVTTEAHQPLQIDHEMSQNYQRRADALNRFFEHYDCGSKHFLKSLLETAKVWISPIIETHYHLSRRLSAPIFTITRIEGGSSVRVNDASDGVDPALEIYLSSDHKKRDCALVTDFPKQLLEALEVQPFNAANELHQYLEVPLESLNMLLVRKGIIGEIPSSPLGSDTSKSDEMSDDEDQSQWRAPLVTPEQSSSVTPLATPPIELPRPPALLAAQSVPSTQSPRDPEPIPRTLGVETSLGNHFSPSDFPIAPERQEEEPPMELVTTAGIYSTSNRSRNRERLEQFAQHSPPDQNNSRGGTTHSVNTPIAAAFDMTQLGSALENPQASVISAAPASVRSARRPQGRHIPDRSQEDRARDFEIGFLGEHYAFTVLRDQLRLSNFSGEDHWTSSLRTRAGFTTCPDDLSDFTYTDTEGDLTRYLQQMRFPYPRPPWLDTVLSDGNKPTYLLEVKSTPSRDPAIRFIMSGPQHATAKRFQVTSTRPTHIYAVVRISGLNAIEDGATHKPQWRVYLDPYSLGEQGVLEFFAPNYTVTAIS